jgi:cellulose synthase/poly-beta-1,6-N-acetylglucosamine synthase-like glycosyltransferase/GGDEF domain-containing protein
MFKMFGVFTDIYLDKRRSFFMTNVDRHALAGPRVGHRSRRVVINRAPERSEIQVQLDQKRSQFVAGVVDPTEFAIELGSEFDRRQRGGRNCAVASISLFEIPGVKHRLGVSYVFDLITSVTKLLQDLLDPNGIINVSEDGEIMVMARESSIAAALDRVEKVTNAIAAERFDARGERILLTPSAGLATLDDGVDASDVIRRAVDAREVAAGHLDLRVHRWEAAMSTDTAKPERDQREMPRWAGLKERLRTPSQIMATYVLGLLVPFCIYWSMANIVGFDITYWMYLFVVATLVSTGVMILVEARLAFKQKEPPDVEEYPEASAIICAYLPNEAGTILNTVEAFLNMGYPGGLQIIVAYNTPNTLPVEKILHKMADENPYLDVVRVEGSTSKAQNVNAVLHMARGAITGMFDADHEPRPGSFERAWRWLTDGYDVVQGHCLTRNGDASWLAKMIAVEFESIYAVAHPGRAKLHRFGVFGGSNGYWRTELLHETRMRGSMLTEDIDSSMRAVEGGFHIRSDRNIVSRELGTTTFQQVWDQRMRWAQGWFQVTIQHTRRVWKSPHLSFRQKCGASYLLGWREVYPWLSLQVFPLVAYWLSRGDRLSFGWPIFLLTTLFVITVGPFQTLFAYKLADDEIKQHKRWFWAYLMFSTFFYTEYKNTIARVSHVKEWVGERSWRITPCGDDSVELESMDFDLDDDDDDDDDETLGDVRRDEQTEMAAKPLSVWGEERTREPQAIPRPRVLPPEDDEDDEDDDDDSAPIKPRTPVRLESGRLNDGVSALGRPGGVPGDPHLPRRVLETAAPDRLDEAAISRRIRLLVERPLPRRAPVDEPLISGTASDLPTRRPAALSESQPSAIEPTLDPVADALPRRTKKPTPVD